MLILLLVDLQYNTYHGNYHISFQGNRLLAIVGSVGSGKVSQAAILFLWFLTLKPYVAVNITPAANQGT